MIALCGSLAVAWYGNKNQTYTATGVMQYTNAAAETGQNPDGTPINSAEIISAAVITDALSDLSLETNVENIRSKCVVSEIVPAEEVEKKAAALKLGTEYSYIPTSFQVSFTVDSNYTKDYARDMLDSILTNYFSLYCEKYVDYSVFPNNAANITIDKYDYLDCVEMLKDTAEEISYYLNQRASNYPAFRSAASGYSFTDLADGYREILDNDIPRLYAYILNNKLVVNQELLLRLNENRKAQYELEIENCQQHIDEAKALLDQFGQKTLEENDLNYSFGGSKGSNEGLIVNNVEEWARDNSNVETTYDRLIDQYIQLQTDLIYYQTKLGKCEEVLATYAGEIPSDTTSETALQAITEINTLTARMNDLYASILPTINEFNEKNGADNLAMLSSISVKERFDMDIFILLALIFFLFVGCFLAIFCGRIADFIEYFMYTDKKTGLPNRSRCDMVIEQYEETLLPDQFVCLVFKVELQFNDMPGYTRKDGDVILGQFGSFAKHVLDDVLFVGYNNDGLFLSFIDNSTKKKARALADLMREVVENYNATIASFPIVFHTGLAESTEDNIYSARALLRQSISNAMQSKPEGLDALQEAEERV